MSRRLALFLMDDGSYQTQLREECLTASRHYGFEARVFVAGHDPHKQVEQIERCLAERQEVRPTVVMVSPVRESVLSAPALAAARVGVGWVLLNRWADWITDLHRQFPACPIFCVSADQHEVGRIQGRQFNALMPGGGDVLYIRGPAGTSSVMRRFAGVQEVTAGSTVKPCAVNSDWTIEGGEREMKAWLRMFDGYKAFPTLLVGAQNDAMAFGAYRAFSNSGRQTQPGAVRFTGVDGSPGHGLRWTSEGQLTATVIIPPVVGKAISELVSMLSGGPRPPAELLLRPSSFPELHVLERIGLEGRTSGVHRRDSKNIRVDAASSRPRISTRRK